MWGPTRFGSGGGDGWRLGQGGRSAQSAGRVGWLVHSMLSIQAIALLEVGLLLCRPPGLAMGSQYWLSFVFHYPIPQTWALAGPPLEPQRLMVCRRSPLYNRDWHRKQGHKWSLGHLLPKTMMVWPIEETEGTSAANPTPSNNSM